MLLIRNDSVEPITVPSVETRDQSDDPADDPVDQIVDVDNQTMGIDAADQAVLIIDSANEMKMKNISHKW